MKLIRIPAKVFWSCGGEKNPNLVLKKYLRYERYYRIEK